MTAVDDYTVRFTLAEPFAAFPIQLVLPPIVPADSGDRMRTSPIGTGPYRFVRYDVDDKVVLSAFEGFWGGSPDNTGLVVKVIPDDTMRGLDLRKGATDLVVNDLPADIVHQLAEDGAFRIEPSPGLDFSYIGFNLRDPILADRRVRHAIGYAINREAIIKYMRRDLARPASGLVPDQAWAFEPDVHRFTHDPARAMRLLDEAGYRDPDGDGPLPRLRLSLKISSNEETRLQSTVVQEDLRRVGIELDLALVRVRHVLRRCPEGELPDVLADVDGRVAGGPRHPASGVPFRPDSPARLQSRVLQQCRGRSPDRPGHAVNRRDRAREVLTGMRRSSSPQTRPTFQSGIGPM